MNARNTLIGLMATTLVLAFPMVGSAEEQHGQEATQHLDQAVESAKQGDTAAAGKHTEEAKQHAIQQNKAKPYRKSPKKISGENPKQEHDEQAFGAMGKAEGHAAKGHAQETGEAAGQAKQHLQDKEQSK
ncbi:Small metal-binding protein [Methylomagnum ishizawai]|uniref:Small metal-binding protein n=1 Tax=Methylomagnum ishizawai TaxID=1760988 RepID=A0A1Y6D380_9GAMM|nr:small metal-binding protein SmbP [Methylomagnum ishizawai]SMF95002.1 Small metal-binding protein [Methylomagnum ishizawai]